MFLCAAEPNVSFEQDRNGDHTVHVTALRPIAQDEQVWLCTEFNALHLR